MLVKGATDGRYRFLYYKTHSCIFLRLKLIEKLIIQIRLKLVTSETTIQRSLCSSLRWHAVTVLCYHSMIKLQCFSLCYFHVLCVINKTFTNQDRKSSAWYVGYESTPLIYILHPCVAIRRLIFPTLHKMSAISQTTFSNAFLWTKKREFRLKFLWSLLLRVQLTKFQNWLNYGLAPTRRQDII